MTLERRKVLIYLRPDISASERFADAKLRPTIAATVAICRARRCWRDWR